LAVSPIAEFHDVDRARFEAEIVPAGRPAVLRGLVADWPVVAAATESAEALAEYLVERASEEPAESWFGPPDIAGRFDFAADFSGFNHERKLASVAQILDLILRQRGSAAPWSVYAGALPVAKHVPGFRADNPMPLLDAGRHMLVSLWLGNRTQTAAHWDLPQNLACVVSGRRSFTVFPPDQVANLYVGPIDFTLAGQPSSLVDLEHPDLDRFPKFAEALAVAQTATLDPGDALYLPSLWWHGVTGRDEVGAMVNYWWRDGPARTLSPFHSLLHAAMTMHELPDGERASWRAFFEHYVFHANGDPALHLPEGARGVLGDRSEETMAALRAFLAGPLSR
jgi:hypothetical protein